jgi:hypothetical protein
MRGGTAARRRRATVVIACVLLSMSSTGRRAAAAPVTPPAAGSVGAAPSPVGAAPAANAVAPIVSAPDGIGPSGGRVGSAEVTIVGGNIASARERALAEALKQSVDQELSALAPQARAAQPKVVVQVLGMARRYVRRYRTLDEGETGRGLYSVRIEAEVDAAALLRAFDKAPAGGPSPAWGGSAPSYFIVGAGVPEAALAATRAFVASGARTQAAAPGLTDPGRAIEAAARAGIPTVAFVSGSATPEGEVRGPGVQSVTCTVGVRVSTSGAGLPLADDSETVRSFADRVDTARADCFARASGAVVPRVVPVAAGRTAPDARAIVIDADVVEPGAVPGMLKQLRELGAVSSIEVRRISAGRVELWVRSRQDSATLAAGLARDSGGAVSFSPTEVTGDLVRVRARLRDIADPARDLGTAPAGAMPASNPPAAVPAARPAGP